MDFDFLSKTDLFKGIAQNDIEELINRFGCGEKTYNKGDIIFRRGTNILRMGIVLSGSVNMVMDHSWGASSIFERTERGCMFGGAYATIPNNHLLCDMIAAEDCKVLFLDTHMILTIRENRPAALDDVIYNIVNIAAEKCLGLAARMMHTASHSLRHRIMSYLAEQAMINGSNKFRLPFGRQQMADYLNADRTAICHELSRMKKEKLINYHKFDFEIFFCNR